MWYFNINVDSCSYIIAKGQITAKNTMVYCNRSLTGTYLYSYIFMF